MTNDRIIDEMNSILRTFNEYARDDPFGWDWATMQVIFPEKVDRYRALRHKLKLGSADAAKTSEDRDEEKATQEAEAKGFKDNRDREVLERLWRDDGGEA